MLKILLSLISLCAARQSEAGELPPGPPPTPAAQAAPSPAPAAPAPAPVPPVPPPPAAPGQGGGTLAQIRALIGAAACSDASQCRTLPIGARPCGGPEGYLAYSTSSAPEDQLLALAERYKQERAKLHAESGVMSNCRFMPDPGAVCVAGTCQLAPPGGSTI